MNGSRPTGIERSLFALLALFAANASFSLGADYYVRTDGNDVNTGTSNSTSGAWRNISKCAATLVAGDRCLVQSGTYLTTTAFDSVRGGSLVGTYAYNCSFTKGSTTVTCAAADAIAAGHWVRSVNSTPHFSWTRVASKSGATLTLEEPYRGTTASGDVRVANFVEYRGINGTPVITTVTAAGKPTFTQDATYSRVWSYPVSGASSPWNDPRGFRENTATWDLWDSSGTGRDTYVKKTPNTCPCSRPTCAAQVDGVPGSWCSDGSRVYLQMRDGGNPNSSALLEAGYRAGASDYDLWSVRGLDYIAVRNFTFIVVQESDGYTANVPFFGGLGMGDGSGTTVAALYENLTFENGVCFIALAGGAQEVEIRGVRCLDKPLVTSGGTSHSGLRFYNIEFRGGFSNNFNVDQISGKSTTDRVIFDRVYLHRSFAQLYATACGQGGNWDCTARNWVSEGVEHFGCHGWFNGNSTMPGNNLNHLLVQNSVIEVTGDGINIFAGNNNNDIVIRNNTFGYSGSPQDNQRSEVLVLGATGATGTAYKIRNNVFYVDDTINSNVYHAIRIYSSGLAGLDSDYNLFLQPYNGSLNASSQFEVWNSQNDSDDRTLLTARSSNNKEQNSLLVCYANCSSGTGIFNDGAASRDYFVRPTVVGGTKSDYTPTASNRGVNAGDDTECPAEDFYGNPRSDGQCDIGAIERQSGAPDTTPPNPVTGFSATGGDRQVTLQWNHSASSDNRGTVVRASTVAYPASVTDGTLVCDKLGAPSAADSCVHTNLVNGTAYYYSAFPYDQAGDYGSASNATATPQAPTPNAPPGPVTNNHRTDVR